MNIAAIIDFQTYPCISPSSIFIRVLAGVVLLVLAVFALRGLTHAFHTDVGAGATKATSVPLRTDVIVVGGGLSGMCAAIAARELGASVTVLDRAHGGGASAISGGVVYAGAGTKHQKEAGYNDSAENMFRYLRCEIAHAVDDATLRRFCDESVANMEWLEGYGVKFSGSEAPYKTSYPVGDYYLHYSGNEKAEPMVSLADAVPRGHRPVGKGLAGMEMTGHALWGPIFDSAIRLGVSFKPASRVQKLLVDDTDRVRGVRYRTLDASAMCLLAARPYRWLTEMAKIYQTTLQPLSTCFDRLADLIWHQFSREYLLESNTVILAAGGFVMNKKMVREFVPWGQRTAPLGTAGDDGSGILLGQSVGGAISHMDRMSAWRFLYPPESLIEGIVISPSGERIAAEDTYGASFTTEMIQQANGRGFLILDSTQWAKFRSEINEQTQGLWKVLVTYISLWNHKRADTLEDLVKKLDVQVDPVRARATVEAYNYSIVHGKPDPVGKRDYRSVIESSPFYAVDISIQPTGIMMVPSLTLGGLKVDGATGLVLNDAGDTITGLYAAGRNAVGIPSMNYVSGLSLADCVFSGRRAGKHAALG